MSDVKGLNIFKVFSNILIVGKGVVGSIIGKYIEEAIEKDKEDCTVFYEDPFKTIFAPEDFKPDLIHITLPFYERDQFQTDVQQIINRFVMRNKDTRKERGKVVIIVDSTISLGILLPLQTFYKDYVNIVYSPVRASEKNMYQDLKSYIRYFAPVDLSNTMLSYLIQNYYGRLGFELNLKYTPTAEELVLGKLAAVSWFTMNIAYIQQLEQICSQHGLKFENVYTLFNKDETVAHEYNPAFEKGFDYFMSRPIFYPGSIEGHCCIPDVIIMLQNNYGDANFWKWILTINETQKYKLRDGKTVIENNNDVKIKPIKPI